MHLRKGVQGREGRAVPVFDQLDLRLFHVSPSPLPLSLSVDNLRWLLRSEATSRVKPTARAGSSHRVLLEGSRGQHG